MHLVEGVQMVSDVQLLSIVQMSCVRLYIYTPVIQATAMGKNLTGVSRPISERVLNAYMHHFGHSGRFMVLKLR